MCQGFEQLPCDVANTVLLRLADVQEVHSLLLDLALLFVQQLEKRAIGDQLHDEIVLVLIFVEADYPWQVLLFGRAAESAKTANLASEELA